MPYGAYLQTSEWAERRRGALRRANDRCETCRTDARLHVHHRTYERRGEERPDDLIVLCEDCHLAVHTSGGSHRPRGLV
jgi:5-methylcytosine-specific restriction endonuclease McrA